MTNVHQALTPTETNRTPGRVLEIMDTGFFEPLPDAELAACNQFESHALVKALVDSNAFSASLKFLSYRENTANGGSNG